MLIWLIVEGTKKNTFSAGRPGHITHFYYTFSLKIAIYWKLFYSMGVYNVGIHWYSKQLINQF